MMKTQTYLCIVNRRIEIDHEIVETFFVEKSRTAERRTDRRRRWTDDPERPAGTEGKTLWIPSAF